MELGQMGQQWTPLPPAIVVTLAELPSPEQLQEMDTKVSSHRDLFHSIERNRFLASVVDGVSHEAD
ncbi:MAG TPA: hypothetical protein VK335_03545 [Bryobacteraceae bacterium]|nr:hypothetical protein [Bryobacteraceae bacterium]